MLGRFLFFFSSGWVLVELNVLPSYFPPEYIKSSLNQINLYSLALSYMQYVIFYTSLFQLFTEAIRSKPETSCYSRYLPLYAQYLIIQPAYLESLGSPQEFQIMFEG